MKANNKSLILEYLKKNDKDISGEYLSSILGISRTAVWKNIQKLIEQGYKIEKSHSGYKLIKEDDLLLPYEFDSESELFVYKESTGSTMDIAVELINKKKAQNGTIVIAEKQSAGKSKDSSTFISPKGGLYFTMILFPGCPLSDINLYPMAALIAVNESLNMAGIKKTEPRWPFETWLSGNKISGVLHEYKALGNRCSWLTLGIGINISTSKPRKELLQSIKKEILKLVIDPEKLLSNYIETIGVIDKKYSFKIEGANIKGRVMNVDRLGTLLIQNEKGLEYGYIGNSSIEEVL